MYFACVLNKLGLFHFVGRCFKKCSWLDDSVYGTVDLFHFTVSIDVLQLTNFMALRNILSVREIGIACHIFMLAQCVRLNG